MTKNIRRFAAAVAMAVLACIVPSSAAAKVIGIIYPGDSQYFRDVIDVMSSQLAARDSAPIRSTSSSSRLRTGWLGSIPSASSRPPERT